MSGPDDNRWPVRGPLIAGLVAVRATNCSTVIRPVRTPSE